MLYFGKFRNRSAFKHETLAKMSKSEKLFVTLEIVNVFRALAFPEITELLTAMFSKPSSKEVRYLLLIRSGCRLRDKKRCG